jgi:hypothetical protein
MRSYETGLYDIRSDGNLRSILDIIAELGSKFSTISITIPLPDQLKNGEEDSNWLKSQNPRIRLWSVLYAENALANRKENVAYCSRTYEELVITYFKVNNRDHTIFLCPGSPRPENPTYSMDEADWFRDQIDQSTATFFMNENQFIREYGGVSEDKIFELKDFVTPRESSSYDAISEISSIGIYFPYRLTDKDYDFENLILNEYPNTVFGITDPNNSLEKLPYYDKIKSRTVLLDPSKHIDNLLTIRDDAVDGAYLVKVYMPSDLRKTIHLGPIEIFSMFRNKRDSLLFPSSWSVNDIQEVREEANRSVTRYYKW